jgi:hypothetical protein
VKRGRWDGSSSAQDTTHTFQRVSLQPPPTGKKPAGKSAKSRAAALDDDDFDDQSAMGAAGAWDWEWGRAAVLRALGPAMGMDLRGLYGGAAGVERMAGLALEVVSWVCVGDVWMTCG